MKNTLLTVLALILVFALGIFAGTKLKKTPAPSGAENSYQAGWDAAQKRLEQTGLGGPNMAEVKTISGTIEKIESNKITIKANPVSALSDPSLDSRTITVSSDTKIFLLTQKDSEQFKKEMDEFQAKMKAQTESKEPLTDLVISPSPQDKNQAQLSDLKVGQQITISSTENIKDKKEFVASEISMMEMPKLPENLPAPSAPNQPSDATSISTPPTPTAPATSQNLPTPPTPNSASQSVPVPPVPVK